jgi:hypothetical protein
VKPNAIIANPNGKQYYNIQISVRTQNPERVAEFFDQPSSFNRSKETGSLFSKKETQQAQRKPEGLTVL